MDGIHIVAFAEEADPGGLLGPTGGRGSRASRQAFLARCERPGAAGVGLRKVGTESWTPRCLTSLCVPSKMASSS